MNASKAKKEASPKVSCADNASLHLFLSYPKYGPNHTTFISPVNNFLGMLLKRPMNATASPKGVLRHISQPC
jgi:hypothetical protein